MRGAEDDLLGAAVGRGAADDELAEAEHGEARRDDGALVVAPVRRADLQRDAPHEGLFEAYLTALGQLADVGVTAAMHGVFPTIRALWQTVQEARASATGKGRGEAGRFNMDDMGLADRIADEFVTTVKNPWMVKGVEISTANFAEKTLKWSGFNFTDEFGKLVNMNAAANALRAKAKSPGGRAELAARYGEYFGTDFTKLVDDLAAGRKSPLVGEAIFRELSDAQPLTKLEMPQAYVGTPSGRFLYTMKSWMIKQMNLVRERGVREMASGDPARARRGAGVRRAVVAPQGRGNHRDGRSGRGANSRC